MVHTNATDIFNRWYIWRLIKYLLTYNTTYTHTQQTYSIDGTYGILSSTYLLLQPVDEVHNSIIAARVTSLQRVWQPVDEVHNSIIAASVTSLKRVTSLQRERQPVDEALVSIICLKLGEREFFVCISLANQPQNCALNFSLPAQLKNFFLCLY